jgi:hypothetical protein
MTYKEQFNLFTKDFSVKFAARDALAQLDKLDCVEALKTCNYFAYLLELKCKESHDELQEMFKL